MSLIKKLINSLSLKNTVSLRFKRKEIVPIQNLPINYLINDHSTPFLNKSIIPDTLFKAKIAVQGYSGGGFDQKSEQGQSANCYVTISNTINFFNSKTNFLVPNWPQTQILSIIPRAGINLNASYNRKALKFFYAQHSLIGKTIYTCDSSDIVAHELGHAILDAYRPATWNAMSIEIASFHEAFADFTAMMHLMLYDEVLEYCLKETKGDMTKSNVVSKLAEDFGMAIYKLTNEKDSRSPFDLRDAVNSFKYVDPNTLGKNAPYDKLSSDCHSFGRIFTGAFYEILVMIYEDKKNSGQSQIDALKSARDILTTYVLKSIQNAPLNVNFFNTMAITLLWSDVVISNRKYHDRMRDIFSNRNLIKTQISILSNMTCKDDSRIISERKHLKIKIKDKKIQVLSVDKDSVYNLKVNIPVEKSYLFDNDNQFYDIVGSSEEENIKGAIEMLDSINESNILSKTEDTMFKIQSGCLVRNFFS